MTGGHGGGGGRFLGGPNLAEKLDIYFQEGLVGGAIIWMIAENQFVKLWN